MQNWADKGQTNRTTGGLDASTLCKKGPYLEFFGSYFPAFGLNSDSFPHTLYPSVFIPNTGNTDQKNSKYRHFSRSGSHPNTFLML